MTSLCPEDFTPARPWERGVRVRCAPGKALSGLTFVKWSLPFSFNLSVRGLPSGKKLSFEGLRFLQPQQELGFEIFKYGQQGLRASPRAAH